MYRDHGGPVDGPRARDQFTRAQRLGPVERAHGGTSERPRAQDQWTRAHALWALGPGGCLQAADFLGGAGCGAPRCRQAHKLRGKVKNLTKAYLGHWSPRDWKIHLPGAHTLVAGGLEIMGL